MTKRQFHAVRVRVPATSANLGPGFDVLGLALQLYDEVGVRFGPPGSKGFRINVEGPGAADIPTDGSNLAYRAIRRVYGRLGRALPGLELTVRVQLPVAGGLGSSSAAIVGGLLAGNASLGSPLSTAQLVDLATAIEGHPDNVLPALEGGLCVGVATGAGVRYVAWKDPAWARGLRAVVCTPPFRVSTLRARRVLSARVARADAIFNAAHVALFLSAFREKRYDLLGEAMRDRMHQDARAPLVPGLHRVIAAAVRAGAYGAALSGAGPTVLALTAPARAPGVGRAMGRAFGAGSCFLILSLDQTGAQVLGMSPGQPRRTTTRR